MEETQISVDVELTLNVKRADFLNVAKAESYKNCC